MNARAFAWRSLIRQPARTVLAVLGVAAVGALLFDMLLLSRGLVLSMQEMLDKSGFDIRVSADRTLFTGGDRIPDVARVTASLAGLPGVSEIVAMRFDSARVDWRPNRPLFVAFVGANPSKRRAWTIVEGRDVGGSTPRDHVVISRDLARVLGHGIGSSLVIRASCGDGMSALPPVTMTIAGIADFPFEAVWDMTVASTRDDLSRACGEQGVDEADLLMVSSDDDANPVDVRTAIQQQVPNLQVVTNEEAITRVQQVGLSYFRQISTVLTTVTTGFALLLISVLLTVSVNQRLGTIAALRALGFSQRRVVADVMWESGLIVGMGGLLSLPLGLVLAEGLDFILRRIPGLPGELHFFVFEPRALVIHLVMLTATAVAAALYPMRIVARLPIASTLRNEVVS